MALSRMQEVAIQRIKDDGDPAETARAALAALTKRFNASDDLLAEAEMRAERRQSRRQVRNNELTKQYPALDGSVKA